MNELKELHAEIRIVGSYCLIVNAIQTNCFPALVCGAIMALITAMVLCARSRDSLVSVSPRRVHVIFSTTGFKGGGKPLVQSSTCSELGLVK